MSKDKKSGCLSYIIAYACFIVLPVIIGVKIGINPDVLPCAVFSIFIGIFLAFLITDSVKKKYEGFIFFPLLIIMPIIVFIVFVNIANIDLLDDDGYLAKKLSQREYTTKVSSRQIPSTSTYSKDNTFSTSSYYQRNYPMTWGYIKKYADDPYSYVEYYDSVWGDLQAYHGDGIVFDTLSVYERRLVNYPPADICIYLSSLGASDYHSTKFCYSLLRSNVITYPLSYKRNYDPCSKCVEQ